MGGYQTIRRNTGLPMVPAGTDICVGPVRLASGTNFGVLPCSKTEEPFGWAFASAPNWTGAVAVYDLPDVFTAVAAATVSVGQFVGVASLNEVTGASGSVMVPQIAPVASASGGWAIGKALEAAVIGADFAFYLRPEQVGLV